jgi:type IV secretion system protein TrbL
MGVYALLVGPIIALVMRVFNVIATGGISASGDVASFYVSAALALIFPIILFVVIWKTIGWAGQPLGVDAAFTMTVAAAIAATGVGAVAVGAGAGSAAVSSASTSGAGGTSGGGSGGSSGGAGGGTSGGTAADPSAATGNSTVGGTMRSSISDALSTREPPAEDSVDPAPGVFSVNKDALHNKSMSVPGVRTARKTAGQTGAKMKKLGSQARRTGVSSARKIVGSESIDGHRKMISQQMDTAAEADGNRDFLTEAYQSGEIDIATAADRGILSGSERPAEGISTVSVDPDGNVTYPTTKGAEASVNINDRAQHLGEQAQTLREDASKSARSVNRIRTAQVAAKTPARVALSGGRATKRVGNTGVQVGKASGVVFAGAMTQSPYAAYQIGKRGGKHLIGPGASTQPNDSSDDTDNDWSARHEGPEQAMGQRLTDDAGGEPSETL